MKISIIAAVDLKRGIGKNNGLLLSIPEDMQRFRTLTHGHPVIMGRRTWDSLPKKPLPNRVNIIISRIKSSIAGGLPNTFFVDSLDKGIKLAKLNDKEEIFVIGGGQIYQQAITKADRLYLTLIDGDFGAGTFFPDYSNFTKIILEEEHESDGYKYKFLTLEK
ncbi:MAG: dihydrofolate reductase [Candidatus Levyibacteriota bacterium]|jgi:dihydrofolate reductase